MSLRMAYGEITQPRATPKVECDLICKHKENSRFKCSEGASDYSLG